MLRGTAIFILSTIAFIARAVPVTLHERTLTIAAGTTFSATKDHSGAIYLFIEDVYSGTMPPVQDMLPAPGLSLTCNGETITLIHANTGIFARNQDLLNDFAFSTFSSVELLEGDLISILPHSITLPSTIQPFSSGSYTMRLTDSRFNTVGTLTSTVPEPGTMTLALLAGLTLFGIRRLQIIRR
jgi:hypothetical protein